MFSFLIFKLAYLIYLSLLTVSAVHTWLWMMMAATWRLLASASSFRMCSCCWNKRSNKSLCLRWLQPSFQGQNNCDAAVMFRRSSTRTRPFVSPCKPSSSSAGPQPPSASEEKTSYKQRQAEHLMHWFLKFIVIVFLFAIDFSFIVIDCIYLPPCFVCRLSAANQFPSGHNKTEN